MRTFIAIEVPEKIRKHIDSVVMEEKKRNLPIKWIKFQNFHITLKFLGEINEPKKNEIIPLMTDVSKKFSTFEVGFEGIGCFPNPRNPRVLWIGVTEGSEKLCEIAQNLEGALSRCGFKEEKRFHSHLTIARIKKSCKVDDILKRTIKFEPFSVNSIILFKSTLTSEGPIYEVLQKFTLG